jgi:zinc-ribbon domain
LGFLYSNRIHDAVFCPRCGAQNADGAAFCSSCGASLSAPPPPVSAGQTPGSQGTPQGTGQQKNHWIAAFLNLFFGLGYIYLGSKKVLGVPTIAFVILVLILDVILGRFTVGIASLLLAILLAVDGWQKANGGKGFISAEYGSFHAPRCSPLENLLSRPLFSLGGTKAQVSRFDGQSLEHA